MIISVRVITIIIINLKLKQLKNFVYGGNVKAPSMNMLSAMFGLPSRIFPYFVMMMFLLFCLVDRNVFQGALYIFLQSDGLKKEIQTIEEMAARNFIFYVYDTYIDFVDEKSVIYQRRVSFSTEDQLPFSRKVDETLQAAFMTPLTNVFLRNELANRKFAFRVCKEKVRS